MQIFYRTELAWAAKALTEHAGQLERLGEADTATTIERGASRLRAEQLRSIAERLTAAVEDGDKRIAIR